jgi:hypothetical protein
VKRWLSRVLSSFKQPPRRAESSIQRGSPIVLEELEQRLVPTMSYHGYGVIPHVDVQPLYYGSGWANQGQTIGQVQNFLAYLVTSPYMDMMSPYGVGHGKAYSGLWANMRLNSSISSSSIASYVAGENNYLPADPNRLYVVFVQPGVKVYNGNTLEAGYHTYTSNGVHYAVIAYPGGGNPYVIPGDANVFDNLTGATSHEIAEAVTDPTPFYSNGAWHGGWFDSRYMVNGEVGDLAAGWFSRLGGYAVQDLINPAETAVLVPHGSTLIST